MLIAEKWTALGTEESTTACAALGVAAVSVGVLDDGSEPRYVCAGKAYGYRSGYSSVTAGVAGCNPGGSNHWTTTYACLCDYTKAYRFEWTAAPGLLSDRGVTID